MTDGRQPFLSIGVTTYNRKELLKRCLASLLRQTNEDFEVLVGNDYTKEELNEDIMGIKDSRIKYINHQNNLGERRNLNSLLEFASGRYFTWQFDDDYYARDYVSKIFKLASLHPDLNCVFTSYRKVFDQKLNVNEPIGQDDPGELMDGKTFLRHYWSQKIRAMGFTGAYRSSYLRALGGVPTLTNGPYALFSEYLLLFLAAKEKWVGYINDPLVFYYVHEGSWSNINTELELYKEAGVNLIERSLNVFNDSPLSQDIQYNTRNTLKLVFHDYVKKSSMQPGFRCLMDIRKFFNNYLAVYLTNKKVSIMNDLELHFTRWIWSIVPILKSKLKKTMNPKVLVILLRIHERIQ